MIDMQKILKITAIVLLFTLFSCETLEPKTYVLHTRNAMQKSQLNELLATKGIYKVLLDSTQLHFKYSKNQTDLKALETFFAANDLINTDTIQVSDSIFREGVQMPVEEGKDSIRRTDGNEKVERKVPQTFKPVEPQVVHSPVVEKKTIDTVVAKKQVQVVKDSVLN